MNRISKCVCSLSYLVCKAHAPYYMVSCGLSDCTIFLTFLKCSLYVFFWIFYFQFCVLCFCVILCLVFFRIYSRSFPVCVQVYGFLPVAANKHIVWIVTSTPRGMRWRWSGEDYMTRSFILCTRHQISFGWSNQEDWDGQDMWHEWGEEQCIQGFNGETWGKETTWMTQA